MRALAATLFVGLTAVVIIGGMSAQRYQSDLRAAHARCGALSGDNYRVCMEVTRAAQAQR